MLGGTGEQQESCCFSVSQDNFPSREHKASASAARMMAALHDSCRAWAGLSCPLSRWAKGPGDVSHLPRGPGSVVDSGLPPSLTWSQVEASGSSMMVGREDTAGLVGWFVF